MTTPTDAGSAELVARLTSYTDAFPDAPTNEAAVRILALETRIRELEEALETVARGTVNDAFGKPVKITVFRMQTVARAALKAQEQG